VKTPTLQEKYREAHGFRKYTVLKTAEGWLALGPGLLHLGEIHQTSEEAHSSVQKKINEGTNR